MKGMGHAAIGEVALMLLARDQGRQAASGGRRSLIVGGWLGCRFK